MLRHLVQVLVRKYQLLQRHRHRRRQHFRNLRKTPLNTLKLISGNSFICPVPLGFLVVELAGQTFRGNLKKTSGGRRCTASPAPACFNVDGPKVVVETAAKRGKMVCGYHASQAKLAPNAYLTGAEWNWLTAYKTIIEAAQSGKPHPNFLRGGLKEGYVKT